MIICILEGCDLVLVHRKMACCGRRATHTFGDFSFCIAISILFSYILSLSTTSAYAALKN